MIEISKINSLQQLGLHTLLCLNQGDFMQTGLLQRTSHMLGLVNAFYCNTLISGRDQKTIKTSISRIRFSIFYTISLKFLSTSLFLLSSCLSNFQFQQKSTQSISAGAQVPFLHLLGWIHASSLSDAGHFSFSSLHLHRVLHCLGSAVRTCVLE